uniref:Uncharacterized protein n=1 Tax=Arundo donax TaxID=35708 RepID=A0A0A8ZFQ5_ARUDO
MLDLRLSNFCLSWWPFAGMTNQIGLKASSPQNFWKALLHQRLQVLHLPIRLLLLHGKRFLQSTQ